MLKVEAIIEEVSNGEVTKLRIGDDVYAIQFVGVYRDIEEAEVIEHPKVGEMNRGEVIAHVGNAPVYRNIANDILSIPDDDFNREALATIIRAYYPTNPASTIKFYVSVYAKFVLDPEKYLEKEQFRSTKKRGRPKGNKDTQKKRKRRKRPKGAMIYNKTYATWITNVSYQLVNKALRTYGNKPTSESIEADTGLSRGQVLAVLQHMKENNKVELVYPDDGEMYYSLRE